MTSAASVSLDLAAIGRRLARRPPDLLIPAATLALVIGVGAAVFAVVDGALLRSLPFPDGERLVRVFTMPPGAREVRQRNPLASIDFVRFRQRTRSLDRLEVIWQRERGLVGAGDPVIVKTGSVSAGFFDLLGGTAILGRTFTGEEDVPDCHVAVLGFGLWQRVFGGDPGVVGRTLSIDGEPHVVVGVMSSTFQPAYRDSELWTPLGVDEGNMPLPNATYLVSVGRLAEGRSLEDAREELARLMDDLGKEAANRRGWTAGVVSLRDYQFGERRPALLLVLAMAVLLVLVAGANVASVTLARTMARQGELATRTLLGATRGNLLRGVSLEALLTCGFGALAGLALAVAGLPLILSLDPDTARALGPIHLDGRVSAAACGAALLLALGSGVWPAGVALGRMTSGRSGNPGAGTRTTSSRKVRRFQATLLVAETAFACVVMVVGGALADAYRRLSAIEPGFDASSVLTAQVRLSALYGTHERRIQFMDRLLETLRSRPGFEAAAAVNNPFLAGFTYGTLFEAEGKPTADGQMRGANFRRVSPGYFAALRIPVTTGRAFADSDRRERPWVAVVSASLAKQVWPGRSPIGRRIRRTEPGTGWMTVVGVVADVKDVSLAEGPDPTLYMSEDQHFPAGQPIAVVVRVHGDRAAAERELRAAVAGLDATQVIDRIAPLESFVSASLAPDRFRTALLVVFAALGAGLVMIGLLGLTSRAVTERTREIAVRLALGAEPGALWRRTTVESLASVAAGIGAGGLAAAAAVRMLAGFLAGVSPPSVTVYAAVAVTLLVLCAAAAAIPARRVMRIDPVTALRWE